MQTEHPGRRGLLITAVAAAAGMGGLSAGCTGEGARDLDGPQAPRAGRLSVSPGTAWVFSSGGPRGVVHVGVLKALDELGLTPSLVVGSSIGALIGCLVAAGLPWQRIEALALELGPVDLVRPQLTGSRWLNVDGLAGWVDTLLERRRLEQLATPFAAVAVNASTREPVAFTHGLAGAALQAACSIEGRFEPVAIHGQRYMDADLVMPLPVRLARQLGAQRVLAIDASAHEDKAPPGTEAWRDGDLRKRALTLADSQAANFTLHPDIGYYAGLRRAWREMAIQRGYEQTLAQAVALRKLHAA